MLEFLTRQSLSLILLSYALIMVLLTDQLNSVMVIFGLLCALWRVAVFTGRVALLSKLMTNLFTLICSALVIALVYQQGMLSILVHLVVLGFSLKFLELRSVRDVHFFVNTGFVLVALFLVFNQSMLMAGIAMVSTLLLLTILLSLHAKALANYQQLKLLSKMVLLSVPLAVVLFIVLPRLPSMWKMPLQNKATTGLSDSVSPGSIAELSQSSELAFRASFDGKIPAAATRYWRVLTLDQFDGKTWSQSKQLKYQEQQVKIGKGPIFNRGSLQYQSANTHARTQLVANKENSYQIILEPHYKHYLPSLDFAKATAGRVLLSDYSLRTLKPVFKRQAFSIDQFNQVERTFESPQSLKQSLQLPIGGNPKTKAWIATQQALGLDSYSILAQLLAKFNQESFRYTLQPALLGEQQIDDFLFTSQAGFCVHYASTYLYVARALNVPARMVTGYLGGELDSDNEFLSVRQYDAHAWVEIWKNQQWQRVDPTAYVAPERVEQGIMQGLDDQSEFLSGQYLSIHRWQANPFLNQLRSAFAKADYLWAVWVINYDNEKQFKLLQNLLKGLPWLNLSILILLLLLSAASIVILWVFKPWQTEKVPSEDRLFNKLYQKSTQQYLVREKGQTIADYCHALSQFKAEDPQLFIDFAKLYNQIKFKPNLSATQRKSLLVELSELQKKLSKPFRKSPDLHRD